MEIIKNRYKVKEIGIRRELGYTVIVLEHRVEE